MEGQEILASSVLAIFIVAFLCGAAMGIGLVTLGVLDLPVWRAVIGSWAVFVALAAAKILFSISE